MSAGAAAARGDDGYEAARSAASQALADAGGKASAAVVFASVQYSAEEVRAGAASILGDTPFIGCSGSSIITSTGETAGAVGVLVIYKASVMAHTALLQDVDGDTDETGRRLASYTQAGVHDAAANLILVDGLAVRSEATMRDVQSRLALDAPMAGGCASDGLRFTGSYQFDNACVSVNGAALMSLGGGLQAAVGARHGYCRAGSPHVVTGAHDNTLETIDGAPAVEFYGRYFDDAARDLHSERMPMIAAEYPLGVKRGGEYIARDIISVDDSGHMKMAGGVNCGEDIVLMMGTREDLLDAAEQSARDAVSGLGGAVPKAALLFNCMGRHKVFGSQASEEIRRIVQVIGPDVPLLGFYTYGEIAPTAPGAPAQMHNKSAVIVLFA